MYVNHQIKIDTFKIRRNVEETWSKKTINRS